MIKYLLKTEVQYLLFPKFCVHYSHKGKWTFKSIFYQKSGNQEFVEGLNTWQLECIISQHHFLQWRLRPVLPSASLVLAFSLFSAYRQAWLHQPLLYDSFNQLKQFSSVHPISSLYLCTSGSYKLNHKKEEPLGCKIKSGWLESCPEANLPLITGV